MHKALAAAGAFVALVVAAIAVIAIQTVVTGDNPTTTEPGDTSRVYYMDRGDCFDGGPNIDASVDEEVLDCDESHDSEVVSIEFFSTYGSEGDEALAEAYDEAEDECREAMQAYVDRLPANSGVEARRYLDGGRTVRRDMGADEERWTVACVAWSADGRFGSD